MKSRQVVVQDKKLHYRGTSVLRFHRLRENFDPDEQTADLFENYRRQQYNKILNRYMQGYKNRFQMIDAHTGELLEDLSRSADSNFALSTFDVRLMDEIQKRINNTIGIMQNKPYEEIQKKAKQSIVDFIDQGKISLFNDFLDQLNLAMSYLTDNTILLQVFNKHIKNFTSLQKRIDKAKQHLNNSIIPGVNEALINKFFKILNELENIINEITLTTPYKKDKDLLKKTINSMVIHIFSTEIGEWLVAAAIQNSVNNGLYPSVEAALKNLSGVKAHSNNPNITVSYQLDQLKNRGATNFTHKADIENISVQFDIQTSGQDLYANVNFGASVKWYKDQHPQSIKIANETHLSHRIDQIIRDGLPEYNVYNTLALMSQDKENYGRLKAALVARNIDSLISGMGFGGDFSQSIIVNGEVYSILDIITQLKDVEIIHSEGTALKSGEFISSSFAGLGPIIHIAAGRLRAETPAWYKAFYYSKRLKEQIKDVRFIVMLHPQKLRRNIS